MSEVNGNSNEAKAAPAPAIKPTTKPIIPTTSPTATATASTTATATAKATTATPTTAAQPAPAAPKVAFHSSNIPTARSANRQDPFAEQNAKAAEKKQHDSKIRKRIYIGLGVVLALALVGLGIWLVILFTQPTTTPDQPADDTNITFNPDDVAADLSKLQNLMNNAFNAKPDVSGDGSVSISGDLNAAEEIFNNVVSNPANRDYINQINLERVTFYFTNSMFDKVIELAEQGNIDPTKLSVEEQFEYYNMLTTVYYYQGNKEKSDEYNNLAIQLWPNLSGKGSSGE